MKTEKAVETTKVARGQTMVVSRMPNRSDAYEAGKAIKKVKGEGNDLSRTIQDGKVPSY